MIIVIGSVVVDESKLPQAITLSREHVERSRRESGCLEHAVHLDAERPNRLVFVERWLDMSSLQAHFAVAKSKQFVSDLSELAIETPSMKLYDASELPSSF